MCDTFRLYRRVSVDVNEQTTTTFADFISPADLMNNVEAAVKISERMAEPESRLGDIRKQMKFLERLREVKKEI